MPGDAAFPTDPLRHDDRPNDDRVDETAAILALDRTLDRLSDDPRLRADAPGGGSSAFAGTAVALRALDDARPPDLTFVTDLEEQLMAAVALDPTRALTAAAPPPRARRRADRSDSERRPFPATSRRRGLVEFVGLAALIAVIFAQAVGGGGNLAFWRGGSSPSPTGGSSVAAPGGDATPATSPVADGGDGVAMERGNPGRTGVYDTTGPQEQPALLWRYADPMGDPMSAGILEPIVAGGAASFSIDRGSGYAVTPFTLPAGEGGFGSRLPLTSPTRNNVAFGGGLIFALIRGGNGETGPEARAGAIVAYDQATARERWRVPVQIAAGSSPVVADGTLVVFTDDGLLALDAATGAERWRTPVALYTAGDVPVARNPAVEGDTVVVNELTAKDDGTGVVGTLRAFRLTTGAERWSAEGDGGYFGPPSISDGVVYAYRLNISQCCAEGWLWARDAATGKPLWASPGSEKPAPIGSSWSAPVVDAAHVFSFERPNGAMTRLTAHDRVTGEVAWQRDLGDVFASEISLADGVLYYTQNDGVVYAASSEHGAELWSVDTADPNLGTPVPGDGYLVVASRSTVYAFGPAEELGAAADDVSGLPDCASPRAVSDEPPAGEPALSLVLIEGNPLGYGVPTGGRMLLADVPTGEPAGDAAVAGIFRTLREMSACERPGAEVALELAGFYSDDYFRRFDQVEGKPGDTRSVYADLFPVGSIAVGALGAPFLLEDGRVAVLAFDPLGDEGTLLVFAEQDGAWLIDEVVDVGVSAEVWRQG